MQEFPANFRMLSDTAPLSPPFLFCKTGSTTGLSMVRTLSTIIQVMEGGGCAQFPLKSSPSDLCCGLGSSVTTVAQWMDGGLHACGVEDELVRPCFGVRTSP